MSFVGKHVLVTGGTGSLGRTVVDRMLTGGAASVTVFSRDEAKQHDLRVSYRNQRTATDDVIYENGTDRLRFRIGDVRDPRALEPALHGIDIVIHAAALKQVPTCELSPMEAVRTNVEGTACLVEAVRRVGGVESVVGISTDKACRPVNVMGMTKALMERVLVEANLGTGSTRFVCVRYGNVVASRGSFVPQLLDQAAAGGPITLTDERMTRFLLTLDRAADTVFAVLAGGAPGEIWIAPMGSARMVDLIDAVRAERDIPVVVTGIRPGEKLHEEIISGEEMGRSVERDGWRIIRPLLPALAGETSAGLGVEASTSEAATLDVTAIGELLRSAGIEVTERSCAS